MQQLTSISQQQEMAAQSTHIICLYALIACAASINTSASYQHDAVVSGSYQSSLLLLAFFGSFEAKMQCLVYWFIAWVLTGASKSARLITPAVILTPCSMAPEISKAKVNVERANSETGHRETDASFVTWHFAGVIVVDMFLQPCMACACSLAETDEAGMMVQIPLGQLKQAAALFEEALKENPDDWTSLQQYLDCLLPSTARANSAVGKQSLQPFTAHGNVTIEQAAGPGSGQVRRCEHVVDN